MRPTRPVPPRIPTGRSGRGGHDELFDSAKAEVRASELMIGFLLFNYYYYLFFLIWVWVGVKDTGRKRRARERDVGTLVVFISR